MCHSVFSLRSPELRSFQFSDVATLKLTTSPPFAKLRDFGVLAQIADEDDLVHAACHVSLPKIRALQARRDRNPVGRACRDVGQREEISHHESGHFQPFVSRRVTAIVEMHCGAKTNQARKASAVGNGQAWRSLSSKVLADAASSVESIE